jgi:hypothetical protein
MCGTNSGVHHTWRPPVHSQRIGCPWGIRLGGCCEIDDWMGVGGRHQRQRPVLHHITLCDVVDRGPASVSSASRFHNSVAFAQCGDGIFLAYRQHHENWCLDLWGSRCRSGTRAALAARGNGTLVSLAATSLLPAVCQYGWTCPPGHSCDMATLTQVRGAASAPIDALARGRLVA